MLGYQRHRVPANADIGSIVLSGANELGNVACESGVVSFAIRNPVIVPVILIIAGSVAIAVAEANSDVIVVSVVLIIAECVAIVDAHFKAVTHGIADEYTDARTDRDTNGNADHSAHCCAYRIDYDRAALAVCPHPSRCGSDNHVC